jgi:pSer/pThr/pTyr-binding forkhead associated (FHA) protein
MWKLVIEDDEGKRTVVPLTRDHYTIGRKEGHTIRLTERNVSRDHAKLQKKPNGASSSRYLLDDLKSYNGVFVNGLRLAEPQEMVHGDLIQIGDYRIIIQDDAAAEAPAPTATLELEVEDLKATVVPGRVRRSATGQMLLARPNRLVMLIGPTPGEEYPLDKDRITVGRAEEATISINHNSVSRLHCEIHRLAEGRFEIVDKASSNGVRVNGADLTRGIIEAGDVLELGDVRFKFVGAGQVFIPNATESQQMAAITDRQADAALGNRAQQGSILPFVLIGLLLGGAAVGGVYLYARARDQARNEEPAVRPVPEQTVSAPATPTNALPAVNPADEQTLRDAWYRRTSSPQDAHKAVTALPVDSPLRADSRFRDVENAWAKDCVSLSHRDRVAAEPCLQAANLSPAVDEAVKRDISAALTQVPTAVTTLTSSSPSGHTTDPTPPATAQKTATPRETARPTATATVPPETPPPQANTDRYQDVYAAVDRSVPSARAMCRRWAGAGFHSDNEKRACRTACKETHGIPQDDACLAAVNAGAVR